jgi:pSer/pThr/pTyr-binding forkhead associated (FHA) protein
MADEASEAFFMEQESGDAAASGASTGSETPSQTTSQPPATNPTVPTSDAEVTASQNPPQGEIVSTTSDSNSKSSDRPSDKPNVNTDHEDIAPVSASNSSTDTESSVKSESFKVPVISSIKLEKPDSSSPKTEAVPDVKPRLKTSSLSPAEQLKQNELPIPYKEPTWGGLCEKPYSFEVLKNGAIIDRVKLTTRSHYVFGRLPSCDVHMEHPSLSRYHAVVQYCALDNPRHQPGWYLYDLDSTHGTMINKYRVKPRVYYRVRVGYVLKFGGSTRLHVLQVGLFTQCHTKNGSSRLLLLKVTSNKRYFGKLLMLILE